MIQTLAQGFLDLLFPQNCIICETHIPNVKTPEGRNTKALHPPQVLCNNCIGLIQYNRPPFCLKCSRFLDHNPQSSLCHLCRRQKPHFDFAWCACLYNETMKNLIHQFKFGQKTMLRHLFSGLMASFINSYRFDIAQFDHLVPIPLSATRLRERGFNQSELLAELISREFKVPLSADTLTRVKNTPSQSLLHQKERWTNITGAFRIKNQINVTDKNILLIDDLLTTGATSSEAAFIFKKAGAKRVGVLTLAVAP